MLCRRVRSAISCSGNRTVTQSCAISGARGLNRSSGGGFGPAVDAQGAEAGTTRRARTSGRPMRAIDSAGVVPHKGAVPEMSRR